MSQRFPPQPDSAPLLAVLAAVNRRALSQRFPGWQPAQRPASSEPAPPGDRG